MASLEMIRSQILYLTIIVILGLTLANALLLWIVIHK